jgi:hypothetical protein
MNNNSPSDCATPVCRRCHQDIDIRSEDELLDKFGGFVRLHCHAADCGHEDWYKEPVLILPPILAEPAPQGPGEVWIHDVMLGLSFKAENSASLDAGIRATDLS